MHKVVNGDMDQVVAQHRFVADYSAFLKNNHVLNLYLSIYL
jgi:hypothetical protein